MNTLFLTTKDSLDRTVMVGDIIYPPGHFMYQLKVTSIEEAGIYVSKNGVVFLWTKPFVKLLSYHKT